MNCDKVNELLDAFLAGTLSEEEAHQVQRHVDACADCARLLQLCRDLRAQEGEVPAGFSASWRQAVRKEEQMEKKSVKWQSLRGIALVAAAFVFLVGGTLLTRDNSGMQDANENGIYYNTTSANYGGGQVMMKQRSMASDSVVEEAAYDMAAPAALASGSQEQQKKLIRRVDFTIKTMAFEQVLENVQAMALDMGGRVEYLSQYGDHETGSLRNASLTLRIPADRLDHFMTDVEAVGNITSYTNQVEDVTDSYYDVQARLDIQLTKMERLETLLKEAAEIGDLIQIESSIADTQYMIDSYRGRLENMDDQVNYSTVSVYIQESRVAETREAGFWERVGAGIVDSMESGLQFLRDAAIFLLSVLPWLVAAALVIVIVVVIRKKKR